ncbi:proteinase inhibitor I4 serpin [Streptomyces spororaveus]|uniref:serpin family protein n=1 Tax=Streptomyces spororaveus TaxID=284039 RepID=UPI00207B0D32|nr:serpin family protein [Streptomyces spororaveus]MCM9076828.1 proteinase inhibitor I4 serpin [Streptomyces spororaveus]
MKTETVRAVNRLTGHWAAQALARDTGTVFAASGVWPLLALLADGASGPARAELAQALDIPADAAAGAARELLAALAGVRGLRAATGLWTAAGLPLEEDWSSRLPAGARGTLTGVPFADERALDAWAAERTGGLIEHVPVTWPGDSCLVLASALALRVRWAEPFRETPLAMAEGPWARRVLRRLSRSTRSLDGVRVADGPAGPVTVLEVAGAEDVDVHLLLGEPGAPSRSVLRTGLAAVTGAAASLPGSELPDGTPGPGLTIRTEHSPYPVDLLTVHAVAFSLSADHDLLDHAPLFGLATATDADRGHFRGISSEPLAIGSARQSAMARFHATGFEAAAVTSVVGRFGGAARPPANRRVRRADVRFDRPFGFLAVHRASRLVLAAGWVTDPDGAVKGGRHVGARRPAPRSR